LNRWRYAWASRLVEVEERTERYRSWDERPLC
jgi:hypothetical protein